MICHDTHNTHETPVTMPAEPSEEIIKHILAWYGDRNAERKYRAKGIARMIYIAIYQELRREQENNTPEQT